MRDQDGFHLLIRRNATTENPDADQFRNNIRELMNDLTAVIKEKKHDEPEPLYPKDTHVPAKHKLKVNEKKQTVKTKKKNPFKKGSWKHQFWKNIRDHISGKFIQRFHNIHFQNFVIWRKREDSDWEVAVRNKALQSSFIGDLKHADKANILISIGDRMYANISTKAYKKLMEVDKIAIHHRLDGWYDGDDEVSTILEDYTTIDNINDLLSYVNYYRQCVYGVYDVQAKCCWYSSFIPSFKILVTFRNGDCKTYKGDMNEFLKDFDLYQL